MGRVPLVWASFDSSCLLNEVVQRGRPLQGFACWSHRGGKTPLPLEVADGLSGGVCPKVAASEYASSVKRPLWSSYPSEANRRRHTWQTGEATRCIAKQSAWKACPRLLCAHNSCSGGMFARRSVK